ncbi:MAG: MFS transporter [Ruminococcus sp.]|nr:MFS transporter [Candidatus Copronaster equi]
MAETTTEKNNETVQTSEFAQRALSANRRYVGTKETIAYVIYDISASFNISKYNDVFITDIVRVGLAFQSILTLIIGVWDVINDIFLAAIVDRTRTRLGKFKPWLIIYAGPGLLLSWFYWLMPLFFGDLGPYNGIKLTSYFIFSIINNLAGSLNNIAKTGMLSTITTNVIERTRLITQANLFSGFVEKGPEILMGILIDVFSRSPKLKFKMPNLFVGAGMITSTIAGIMALYFSIVAKERVLQKEERPKILDGVKSIINNKPLLILTLEEFLSALCIDSGLSFYYINVLGLASMSTIVGIPGAVVSPISYSYVTKARERFSSKALWIFSSLLPNVLMLGVFGIGSVNKNYKKVGAMIPAFMIRETIWMSVFGISRVIPEEMRNECIDYGEWKNGYRTEGITGVAKGLAKKLVSSFGTALKSFILKQIGYKEGAGYGNQSEHTEYMLFVTCTIIPVVTSIFALIPKLFYPIDAKTRERMYIELNERRQEVINVMNEKSEANPVTE